MSVKRLNIVCKEISPWLIWTKCLPMFSVVQAFLCLSSLLCVCLEWAQSFESISLGQEGSVSEAEPGEQVNGGGPFLIQWNVLGRMSTQYMDTCFSKQESSDFLERAFNKTNKQTHIYSIWMYFPETLRWWGCFWKQRKQKHVPSKKFTKPMVTLNTEWQARTETAYTIWGVSLSKKQTKWLEDMLSATLPGLEGCSGERTGGHENLLLWVDLGKKKKPKTQIVQKYFIMDLFTSRNISMNWANFKLNFPP